MAKKPSTGGIRRILLPVLILIVIIFTLDSAAKVIYPVKYKKYVFKYSTEYNIDPYLVFAIIKAESGFNPNATSKKNARGLMQISGKTAEWAAKSIKLEDFTPDKLYNPEINIMIGCWYINRLMQEFSNNTDLVITAYNGGSGNVTEWLKNRDYSSSGISLDRIPYRETETFVNRVKNSHIIYKRIYENSN